MLVAEYDYDTDIAVQREEERQIAFAQGIEQGFSDGSYQTKLETAKLMKEENCDISFIQKMTGLSQEEVESV